MIEGGCRCGAVRYAIAVDELPRAYACHCHICQRWSGSAFSLNALVPVDAIAATGPVEVHEFATEDRVSAQRFCGTCKGRIFNTNSRRPGIGVIRGGTLDRSEELDCVAHIFTAYKQGWVVLPDDRPAWAEAAPPADFIAALMG